MSEQNTNPFQGKLVVGDHGVIPGDNENWKQYLETREDLAVTPDMVNAVQEAEKEYIADFAEETGRVGLEAMRKDSGLAQVSAESNFAKNKVGAVLHRSRSLPDGNGGMKEKKGVMSVSYKTDGQVGSKGRLKKIRARQVEQAADL